MERNFGEDIYNAVDSQLNGTMSKERETEFRKWYLANEENKNLYKKVVLLAKAERIQSAKSIFDNENEKEAAYLRFMHKTGQQTNLRQKLFATTWKYAAVIAAAFFVGFALHYIIASYEFSDNSHKTVTYKVMVPNGSKGSVLLADGTVVWLNSGSELIYDSGYGATNRDVKMNGEGNFDVAKNPELPFRVISNKITVKVFGTKFNFKSYYSDKLARVTLIEGSLQVKRNDTNDSTLLKPNQQAVYISAMENNSSFKISKVDAKDYEQWTQHTPQQINEKLLNIAEIAKKENITMPTISPNNAILFDNEPLFQIVNDLERIYDVSIQLNDKEVLARHFYGNFRNDESLYDIISLIATTNNLHYKIETNTIIFY